MIYLDTTVALAWLLTEDRQPRRRSGTGRWCPAGFLEYEIWTPLRARGLADSHGEAARRFVGRIALVELTPRVLARALDAFPGPGPLRTLDALHLASCAYLLEQDQDVELASYDRRMNDIARADGHSAFRSRKGRDTRDR